jgi:hypothetical protein
MVETHPPEVMGPGELQSPLRVDERTVVPGGTETPGETHIQRRPSGNSIRASGHAGRFRAEVCQRCLCSIESLGICLPCLAMHFHLRMTCPLVHQSLRTCRGDSIDPSLQHADSTTLVVLFADRRAEASIPSRRRARPEAGRVQGPRWRHPAANDMDTCAGRLPVGDREIATTTHQGQLI